MRNFQIRIFDKGPTNPTLMTPLIRNKVKLSKKSINIIIEENTVAIGGS